MTKTRHNAERTSWKGKSYKKGGERVRVLRNVAKGSEHDQNMRELAKRYPTCNCPPTDGQGNNLWASTHDCPIHNVG